MRRTLLILVLSLLAAPSTAAADLVPCLVDDVDGPDCQALDARVDWAADGDTLRPQIKVDGEWSAKRTVRLTGIQTPELDDYTRGSRRGECLGVEAAETLDRLVHGREMRLVSMYFLAGSGSRERLRSTVQVNVNGRWVDPATVLLKNGLAFWEPSGKEWAWNNMYSRLAEDAARRGVGIWNPVACGEPGPAASSPLRLKVKWNGAGQEIAHNREWVRITNEDHRNVVPLGGWYLRDASTRIDGKEGKSAYRFPAGTVIAPGGSIIVHVGQGVDVPGDLHWGLSEPLFQNAKESGQTGDGVYLFDPDLELRAYVQYPCRTSCGDPLDHKVAIVTRYAGGRHEWITLANLTGQWLSLNEYEIENVPWFYEFGPRDFLAPGRAITLWVRQPADVPVDAAGRKLLVTPRPGLWLPDLPDFSLTTRFVSWNHDRGMLADDGDFVALRNPDGAPVAGACQSWAGRLCPNL